MPALTAARRLQVTELFAVYDADKSGKMSLKELGNVIRALGFTPTNAEMASIVSTYDKNGDGQLSFDEFVDLIENEKGLSAPLTNAQLTDAFKVFDKDGSGALSRAELTAALTGHGEKMTAAEVDAMIKKFDTDGDGKIKYSEFVKMNKAVAPPVKESVRSKINWSEISKKLPTNKNSAEEQAKRKQLFKAFDPNGNGYLSLAECQKGFRDVLALDAIFDVKPVMMRAFQAAKSSSTGKGKTSKHGPDFVEFREFRLFLIYVRQYFELWQMFDEVDTADDSRIDLPEFEAALGKIAAWGLVIDDAEAEFKKIDKNGGGQVLFDEFADWALAKKLDLEDDDDEDETA